MCYSYIARRIIYTNGWSKPDAKIIRDDHTNMLTYNRTGIDAAEKTMTYQGNRMTKVESSGNSTPGAVNYDDIGRVVSSDIEGMAEVQYNVVGFPSYIGQADGGYVDFSGNLPKYCWYTKDHLGNVRAVADAQGYMVALYDYRHQN